MNDNNTRDYTGLSASELAFQLDSANWKYGPTFNVRFFFDHPLDFSDFEATLLDDQLCISEPKLNTPGGVLLRHDHFPGCIGARYYDFQRPDRREPTLVFYPRQYRRFLCGQRFSNAPKPGVFELCRYLAHDHREAVFASETERRVSILPEMKQILLLDEWHHPDLANGKAPSQTETFQRIASVLEQNEPKLFSTDEPVNNHWKNWPEGGTL
ncbi:DUF7003 family protein [Cochlodiniinecator piscidefendens]|uniref:DUF7003 family protein n=1 Tax=Cochlodiniinecator piscidefendens TaxID=2715756 RepID=UPI001408F450|nr:hypothetical protein [Cochlodiniinecator piscidefendens]